LRRWKATVIERVQRPTLVMVLEPRQISAERSRRGTVVAERDREVLVDVGVHGDHRPAPSGEVAAERRRRRGLAAAALADERDAHGRPPVDRPFVETITVITYE